MSLTVTCPVPRQQLIKIIGIYKMCHSSVNMVDLKDKTHKFHQCNVVNFVWRDQCKDFGLITILTWTHVTQMIMTLGWSRICEVVITSLKVKYFHLSSKSFPDRRFKKKIQDTQMSSCLWLEYLRPVDKSLIDLGNVQQVPLATSLLHFKRNRLLLKTLKIIKCYH